MPSTLSNPLRLGLRQERVISPQCLVIFGASGDLTHRKLIPALFELYLQRRIPSEFGIVGCARRPWTDNEFREKMKVKLSNQISGKEREWEQFSNYLFYEPVDLQQSDHVVRLSRRLNEIDKAQATHGNRTFSPRPWRSARRGPSGRWCCPRPWRARRRRPRRRSRDRCRRGTSPPGAG